MTTKYMQCEIQKGNVKDVTWVEETKAQEGRAVRIKRDGSEAWEEGWTVNKVYSDIKLPEEAVKAFRDAYRHHRKNTDI